MNKNPKSLENRSSHNAVELRKQAEAQHEVRFANNQGRDKASLPKTEVEIQRLIHELQVHQIELEMQNEELYQASLQVEVGLEQYTDLYDFAPVGYFTLGSDGNIKKVNLNGAFLLGIERASIIGMRFGQFVADRDRLAFSAFLMQVFTLSFAFVPKNIEVALCEEDVDPSKENHPPSPVSFDNRQSDGAFQRVMHIQATVEANGTTCRAIVMDITKHKHMETELQSLNNRLEQRVEERTLELHHANQALADARETERRALALELHDELGQVLNAIKLSLDMVPMLGKERGQMQVVLASEMVGDLVNRVRLMILDLRPHMLDDLGLLPTLQWLFDTYYEQTEGQVKFNYTNLDQRFSPQVEIITYRIIQEALTNISRHALDKEVVVDIQADEYFLNIQISDQGGGFDVHAALRKGTSTGLSGMRERARQIRGNLTIESAIGEGTTISVVLPIKPFTGPLTEKIPTGNDKG